MNDSVQLQRSTVFRRWGLFCLFLGGCMAVAQASVSVYEHWDYQQSAEQGSVVVYFLKSLVYRLSIAIGVCLLVLLPFLAAATTFRLRPPSFDFGDGHAPQAKQ